MVEMVNVKINGQYDIVLPKHRADRPEWYLKNGWEKPRLEALKNEIKAQIKQGLDPIVFYVGSEEGDMSALCQMWGAEVVLFEPNPKVWSNTKAIWEANNLKTPICIEAFASDETSNQNFNEFIHINEWPKNAYREIEAAHGFKELNKEGMTYPQVCISEVIGYDEIKYPTIVTMDVEGAEGHVLRGMESLMKSHLKPTIFLSLHPEFLQAEYGEWAREIRDYVINFGYKETLLDYQHEVHLLYEHSN